jgi:AraC family transcriptional regulator
MSKAVPGRVLNGEGIQVGQHATPPGEHLVPALPFHLVCLHLGDPVEIFQRRDGRTVRRRFVRGDCVVVPAGMPNLCAHRLPTCDLYLGLAPSFFESVAVSAGVVLGRHHLRTSFGGQDATVWRIGRAFIEALGAPRGDGQLRTESLAVGLAMHLVRRYAGVRDGPREPAGRLDHARLRHVLDFIHSHLADDLSLSDVATRVGLSPYHFSRLFKQSTGFSPYRYLLTQRVEAARRLLLSTSLSPAEVASEVGFYDQSHLTRHFKRLTGFTPAAVHGAGFPRRKNIQDG